MRQYHQMFINDNDNNYFRENFISLSINQIVDDAISINAIDKIKQLFRIVRDVLNFRIFRQIKNRQKNRIRIMIENDEINQIFEKIQSTQINKFNEIFYCR